MKQYSTDYHKSCCVLTTLRIIIHSITVEAEGLETSINSDADGAFGSYGTHQFILVSALYYMVIRNPSTTSGDVSLAETILKQKMIVESKVCESNLHHVGTIRHLLRNTTILHDPLVGTFGLSSITSIVTESPGTVHKCLFTELSQLVSL